MVYQPGSVMKATDVRVTSAGPALGEVVASGELLDDQGRVLATFRQRFRAWLGRPLLELRVELTPTHRPHGYAWHAYYGARFAWRDEHATLVRGVNGTPTVTTHTRPVTPDYLELRCVRDPAQARQVNARGEVLADLGYSGDTVYLDVAEGELLHLRVDFTREETVSDEPPEASTFD